MQQITPDNCRLILTAFIEKNNLNIRRVAKAIGCSEPTLSRILALHSSPSDEMMKQVGIMIELGFIRYSKLSNTQKEYLSATMGAIGGGISGFHSISAAIDSLGVVKGLSAAGVTSGLAALGAIVGRGMVAGVLVAAAIPVAAVAAGYSVIKGVNYFTNEWKLNVTEFDERWEIPLSTEDE